MFEIVQYVEASLWGAIGATFLVAALWPKRPRRRPCVTAAVVFALFGVSDVIEARTGAWWQPWWLFALKAGCVAAMLGLLWAYYRARRSGDRARLP